MNFYIACDIPMFTVLPFDEHYFAYDIYRKTDYEVFIDCGAFTGDTLDIFVRNNNGKYKSYVGIETDKKILQFLKRR